jgi:Xaa-Pro aminopeptidase
MVKDNLNQLRNYMHKNNLDAYIIPMTDPHMSEYVAAHWKSIKWFSGFSGSAGTIVVTQNFAGLWTDSRYFIQAAEQLKGSGIELVKLTIPHTPEYIGWLNKNLPENAHIGFDGKTFSYGLAKQMQTTFERKQINLNPDFDFVGEFWRNRPPVPENMVFEHEIKYAGESRRQKISKLREKMSETSADYHLFSSLDDIAWLFNLRGSDIMYNPLFISFALISQNETFLFVDDKKLSGELKQKLVDDEVIIKNYDDIYPFLSNIQRKKTIIADLSKTNYALYKSIPGNCDIVNKISIASVLKSVKNKTEIEHIRKVQVKDGVAMVKFLHWLDKNLGKEKITEISAGEKLLEFRKEQEGFFGESFGVISAYGAHAAMPHYSATEESNAELKPKSFYLVDSGGQYVDGTTDITRTIALGTPTKEEKRDFTLALKGTIDLAMSVFPYGTKGVQLDAIARKPLWDNRMNYGHGTGHGVGFFLNVHEGPQSISTRNAGIQEETLEAGMYLSDEPAFYRTGKHGIRIENLIIVMPDEENDYGKFLKFETVTLCPIDTKPVDINLLTKDERNWLNNYHKTVYEKLSTHLPDGVKAWLKEKTKEI